MSLRVKRVGDGEPTARVADYLAPHDHVNRHTDGRETWTHHHRRTADRYTVDRRSDERLVDRTVFHLSDEAFVEAERVLEEGGENVHRHPIALPAVMRSGERVEVGPGATVMLLYAGPVRLSDEAGTREAHAIALLGEEGGRREVQWLVRGEGVVWLGPLGGKPRRWLLS